jgi:hypothetical protein
VRFQLLTAASVKITVFCLAVSIIRAIIALMMEAARTYEKSLNFYQTTWRNIPEDSHLQVGYC